MPNRVRNIFQQLLLSWSSYCITSWGWRKFVLSFCLGGISVLALPPVGWFFMLFFTMPSLVWMLDGAVETSFAQQTNQKKTGFKRILADIYAIRSAFGVGFGFGFGYFFVGLLWIGEAFLVDAQQYIYLLPIAVTMLPAFLALFWAMACLVARYFWAGRIKNIIILSVSLTVFEYLRGNILTGLPWNLLGFAFDFSTAMLQSASVWGVYGLTFWVFLVSLSVSLLASDQVKMRNVIIGIGCFFAVFWGAGTVRLNMYPTQYHDNIVMRLVQGNIAQVDKWRPEMRSVIANRYLELSGRKTTADTSNIAEFTHLIWPESAVPFLLNVGSGFMRETSRILGDDAYLITGAVRKQKGVEKDQYFNSVLAFDADGNRLAKYDKHHLVPFGEYLPFNGLLETMGINKLISFDGSFSAGIQPTNIYLKNTPAFAPVICFEIIFSGQIVDRKNRPEWILNLTNDAWFGQTIGPYQHLAQARMRAIEEGLPLVRIANTGVSAVFDPLGREIARLRQGKTAILDTPLPLKIEPTLFVKMALFF